MSMICGKCRRANPPEATFCYYDGVLLNSQARNGPVAGRQLAFPHPFIFPCGRQCRTFDELVLACQEEWAEARSLLEQGYLESFLAGVGRTDLARFARLATAAPDRDRSLDDLLDKLPSDALQPPRLQVQPQEINLGSLQVGEDRRFMLHLENRGMRLLRGSVSCDGTPWLTLGDAGGSPEKLFQFTGELFMPVHVQGKRLRASSKQLEGHLAVESNGGVLVVTVRAEVPVKPYPEGVLQGAVTPRQVAEKAKAAPKGAAGHFEKGKVAQWYQDNGWIYPVQGPAASGLGAVQQFFEALGLTPPPKVEVSVRTVHLAGAVGERLEYPLEVKTPEKRPVYAYGSSNQPWLQVGRASLQGRIAILPLVVQAVPDRPGDKLQAEVLVTANGNQRFPVSVALAIDEHRAPARPVPVHSTRATRDVPVAAPWQPPPTAIPVARPKPREDDLAPVPPARRTRRWIHLLPVWLLLLALLGVFVYDLFPKSRTGAFSAEGLLDDPRPRIAVQFHDQEEEVRLAVGGSVKPEGGGPENLDDGFPAVWEPSMRFGVVMLEAFDPRDPGKPKQLTFAANGTTNNTVIRLDGQQGIFGEHAFRLKKPIPGVTMSSWPGRWKEESERDVRIPADGKDQGEGRHRCGGTTMRKCP